MNRLLCLIALTATVTISVNGQCSLPEVRGLAVGMTVDQVKQKYRDFKLDFPVDKYGYAEVDRNFTLEAGQYESHSSDPTYRIIDPFAGMDKAGITAVGAAFLDEKIVTLVFSYKTDWPRIEDFVTAWASPLKLPPTPEWSKVDRSSLRLDCDPGAIYATLNTPVGGSRVTIGKKGIRDELARRRQAEKDKGRGTFKP